MSKTYYLKETEKNILVSILVVGIITAILVYIGVSEGITRSTVKREKLKNKSEFNMNCVATDTGYLEDVHHTAQTLQPFFEETGVQPNVLVVGVSDKKVGSIASSYFKERKLGTNDMLVVYERLESKKGVCYIETGSNASKVIDEQAKDIYMDYLESYVSKLPSLDACITKAFYDTSEKIMGKPDVPAYVYPLVVICADLVVLVVYFYCGIYIRRVREKRNRRPQAADSRKYRGY